MISFRELNWDSRDEWPSPVSHVCVCVYMYVREAHRDNALYCTRSFDSGLSDACRRACLCPRFRRGLRC